MQKECIHSPEAPAAIGPYSQALRINNIIYFSGQIPLDPKTMTIISEDFSQQAKQVLNNLEAVATRAGGSLNDIVKLTIYLIDLDHFSILNELMLTFFKEPYPARTTIQVAALPKASQIEIDAIMVIQS